MPSTRSSPSQHRARRRPGLRARRRSGPRARRRGRRGPSSVQRLPDGQAEGAGHGRGEGVAYLTVGAVLRPEKPSRREALHTGDHRMVSLRARPPGSPGPGDHRPRRARPRPAFRPGPAGAGRAEVGTAALLAPPHDGGSDAQGALMASAVCPRPAPFAHQIVKCVANMGSASGAGLCQDEPGRPRPRIATSTNRGRSCGRRLARLY